MIGEVRMDEVISVYPEIAMFDMITRAGSVSKFSEILVSFEIIIIDFSVI